MSERLTLLEIFRSKARCAHTQRKAESAYDLLREYLTARERSDLMIAWAHIYTGEGIPAKQELDEVCKEIKERWEG